jgi:hypothetical protein
LSFYQTLLSVVVEHSYNQSGVCPCLQFNPTDKTRAVLRKAGLLCKETTSGIQIVYDQSRLEALQLYAQDSQEPLSFDFKVYTRDPDFRSYSEPFSAAQDGILYFDNRSAGAPGKQALTAAEVVSVKDFKSEGASEFADLLNQRDCLLPPEFILRIFADSTRGALLPQWLSPEPTVYSIHFNSRQRYWKYYLLGKMVANNKAKTGYSVVDPDDQVEFEAMGEEMLSDQRIAYTFRSKQQIPLNERYSFRFQLKQSAQGRETVVMPRLPVASVRQAGMEAVAEQQTMVSEIYINS